MNDKKIDEKKLFYERLKEKRESENRSLEEISDSTKIDIKYLLAIDNGDFSLLPNVYMRLFIRSYAQVVGIDSKEILNDFEFHTLGKENITKNPFVVEDDIKGSTTFSDDVIDDDLNLSPVSTKKILTITVTIIILLSVIYLVTNFFPKEETQANNKSLAKNSLSQSI